PARGTVGDQPVARLALETRRGWADAEVHPAPFSAKRTGRVKRPGAATPKGVCAGGTVGSRMPRDTGGEGRRGLGGEPPLSGKTTGGVERPEGASARAGPPAAPVSERWPRSS